jgi:hypothetical protein
MAISITSILNNRKLAPLLRALGRGVFPALVLLACTAVHAQDRTEIVNKSGQSWTLALVEGTRPGRGSLTLVDKFSGRTTGTLAKVGDGTIIPPQGRLLVVFNREAGFLYRHFILRDRSGFYGEYCATVEFLSTPRISVHLVDQHVGPPMDHADEAVVKQFLLDAIEIGSENIIIHPNSLGATQVEAARSGNAR